ncbi:MAG: hypothetical protein KGL39_05760 [Patescibacteria group bacterium]|nr:hypothetical protein [Patescibacteria group bacterium]
MDPVVTVLVKGQKRIVHGRTAAIIALLTVYADRIERVDVGGLDINFAHAKTQILLRESLRSVRLEEAGKEKSAG